jgi:hypothetical protein
MKLESKLFDAIRIKPRHEEKPQPQSPVCDWEGCDEPGTYRAPKGNRVQGQYHNFCLEHVRHYNTAFNFFEGMKPEEMEAAATGSARGDARPNWGAPPKPDYSGPRMPRGSAARTPEGKRFSDPLHIFARYARAKARGPAAPERMRPVNEQDRRALEALGLLGPTPAEDIKKAYKTLVKLHHPDANGGNKASEERLRTIIAAYSHLKTKGFVGR